MQNKNLEARLGISDKFKNNLKISAQNRKIMQQKWA